MCLTERTYEVFFIFSQSLDFDRRPEGRVSGESDALFVRLIPLRLLF